MAQQALRQEDIPKGGIADFIMADEDLAYLEAANAEKQFGNAGIAKFDNVARRMASYGRYGDDLVAHVETGEIVVRILKGEKPGSIDVKMAKGTDLYVNPKMAQRMGIKIPQSVLNRASKIIK